MTSKCRACGYDASHSLSARIGPQMFCRRSLCGCDETTRQIAALRAGLDEIKIHGGVSPGDAVWMTIRAATALKEADGE